MGAANVQFADDRDFEAHRKRDTEARKVADEKHLGSLIESCQTKFSEFEAWQKLRVEDWRCWSKRSPSCRTVSSPHEEATFRAIYLVQLRMLMRQPQESLVSFLASEADGGCSPLLLMLATQLLILFSRSGSSSKS